MPLSQNDDAALTEQQDQTSHLVNLCDAINNETARETAQPAKTKQSRSERFMWAYFNSWVTGDANDVAPRCTVVPMTRRLSHEEEAMLVEYFCDPGPKCIPSGLPHAHKGKSCVLLTAQATKEMVKLTADKGIAHVLRHDIVYTIPMVPATYCDYGLQAGVWGDYAVLWWTPWSITPTTASGAQRAQAHEQQHAGRKTLTPRVV